MSQQKLSDFDNLEKELTESVRRFGNENFDQNWTIRCIVQDSIYCRTFELRTFYEFNDYQNIDLYNIDYQLEFQMMREDQQLHQFASVRITTYPGVDEVICMLNPKYVHTDCFLVMTKIAEQFAKSIGVKQVIISTRLSNTDIDALQKVKWKLLLDVTRKDGHLITFLTKSI